MDGILLILASWVVVALLCYFFILTYSRRAVGPVQSTTSEPESVKSFQRDVLTWLFWGLDENARNQHQKLAPIFEQFVTKSLNDSSHRLHLRQKEHRPEVHFDAVNLRDKSTIAALQSFRIHPNRTPGNHLSVSGKVAHTRAKGGPIFIKISVTEAEAQTQFGGGKVPTLNSPAIRRHSVNVHELIGDIEIRIASIAGELFVIGCFKERPVVQLELVETNDEPRKAFLEEFVQRCIRGAVMNFRH